MAEPIHDPRGSLWRVWDLHFHTPSSFDYIEGGVSNEEIVRTLLDSGVAVVGITDHHLIDIERIGELQALAGNDLVVLPGIEVRTELGGTHSVHLVAILLENCDLRSGWDTLRVKHRIQQQIEDRGHESVYVDCREFADDIHELGGLTIIHAGSKSNSIEEIANCHAFKQALKTDLAREVSDLFEIANTTNIPSYRKVVFPKIGKTLPLVLCSDSHGLSTYSPPKCWLKADPSFYGLNQVLYDPWDRVHLGDEPPLLERVRQNRTRYLDSIIFNRIDGSTLTEAWFDDVTVPLNPGLVAIIGNKGSGKSALAETIGLIGGCRDSKFFSFFHKDRFLHGRTPKAAHFTGTIRWLDNTATDHLLSQTNADLNERVRYIPQNYLETICNDLQIAEDSEFGAQIEQVIMSHVPIDDRAGHETLRSLIEKRSSEIKESIEHAQEKVRELNAVVVDIEYRLGDRHRAELTQSLESLRREIQVLDEAKPPAVAKPADDLGTSAKMKAKLSEIEALDTQVQELEDSLQQNARTQAAARQAIVACERLLQGVENYEARYVDLKKLWDEEGKSAGVELSEVVTHEIDKSPLEKRLETVKGEIEALQKDANPTNEGSFAHRLAAAKTRRTELLVELSAPQQAYQKYQDDLKAWEAKRAELVGDEKTPDTLTWFTTRIQQLEQLPARLAEVRDRRGTLVKNIFAGLEKWRTVYIKAYEPVQYYIDTHTLISDRAKFEFSVSITDVGFSRDFFGLVHQGRKGSFCRDGEATLKKLIDNADLKSSEGTQTFIDDVLAHLSVDKRDGDEVEIESQLKDGASRLDLYNFLFTLGYLAPTYALRWAGKELDLLSPGEKGALLLVFYLLIDNDAAPLIIDQPEENLDNQTVYDVLVPCINEARRRRQIILVTHNPNLAVACDADQVIRASLDAENSNKLKYDSGAIENPFISAAIVDVLEGTKPAFEKRERKYVAAMPDWSL